MGGAGWLIRGAVAFAVMLAVGCGGGESSTVGETARKGREYPWLKGPSREFLVPGGDNVVQTFGNEATPGEREQASRVLALWMRARAAQDWKKDCSYFSRAYKHSLVAKDATRVTHGKVKTCPQALEYFGHLASGSYENNFTGDIDSLRVGEVEKVGGNELLPAYAQYHGTDGKDWVIPLQREDGVWKIAIATPLNRLR
jgi:hypothetical protein